MDFSFSDCRYSCGNGFILRLYLRWFGTIFKQFYATSKLWGNHNLRRNVHNLLPKFLCAMPVDVRKKTLF